MKFVRFSAEGRTSYGILRGSEIQAIRGKPYRNVLPTDRYYKLGEVRLLAPEIPSKIIGVAANYHAPFHEQNRIEPDLPVFFFKPPTSIIGPDCEIYHYPDIKQLYFEGELGLVISKQAREVTIESALEYVFGYTCVNDVTAREYIVPGQPWGRAKGADTYCPIGPCIETELDPADVDVETYLNGELKQKGNTSDMIFSAAELISNLSRSITLLPGDIIATGTPSGAGQMLPDNTVEIRIKQIGSLRNTVILKHAANEMGYIPPV